MRLCLMLLLAPICFSQTTQITPNPPCVLPFTLTPSILTSQIFNNNPTACDKWTLTLYTVGSGSFTLTLQDAPGATPSTPGSFVTYAGTTVTGSNPMTAMGIATFTNGTVATPWLRLLLSGVSGSITAYGVLQGSQTLVGGKGGGGGGQTVLVGPQVTLTSANIINNDTVTLIPAAGPNTFLQLLSLTAQYIPGTLPFGQGYSIDVYIGGQFAWACTGVPTNGIVANIGGGACTPINPAISTGNQDMTVNNDNGPSPGGAVGSATVTAGHAGLLYAVNDTGTISGCGGGVGTNATYQVTGIGAGGAVTSVAITVGGENYSGTSACATGVTTGSGNGALELDLVLLNGNGSIVLTPVYVVVPLR